MCLVENEDVVGAAPRGDAPTTSELSTILLLTKVRLILEDYGSSGIGLALNSHSGPAENKVKLDIKKKHSDFWKLWKVHS